MQISPHILFFKKVRILFVCGINTNSQAIYRSHYSMSRVFFGTCFHYQRPDIVRLTRARVLQVRVIISCSTRACSRLSVEEWRCSIKPWNKCAGDGAVKSLWLRYSSKIYERLIYTN